MEQEAVLPTLRIQLPGDFCLVYGGSPLTHVYTPRLQLLLAYLVLHRVASRSRQHLAFLFCPHWICWKLVRAPSINGLRPIVTTCRPAISSVNPT